MHVLNIYVSLFGCLHLNEKKVLFLLLQQVILSLSYIRLAILCCSLKKKTIVDTQKKNVKWTWQIVKFLNTTIGFIQVSITKVGCIITYHKNNILQKKTVYIYITILIITLK